MGHPSQPRERPDQALRAALALVAAALATAGVVLAVFRLIPLGLQAWRGVPAPPGAQPGGGDPGALSMALWAGLLLLGLILLSLLAASFRRGLDRALVRLSAWLRRRRVGVRSPRQRLGRLLARLWWRHARVPDALLLPMLYRIARAVEHGEPQAHLEPPQRPRGRAGGSPGEHLAQWLLLTLAVALLWLVDARLLASTLPALAHAPAALPAGSGLLKLALPSTALLLAALAVALGALIAALERYDDSSLSVGFFRLVPLFLLLLLMALHGGAVAVWVRGQGAIAGLKLPPAGLAHELAVYGGPALGAMVPALLTAFAFGAWQAFLRFLAGAGFAESHTPWSIAAVPGRLEPREREVLDALRGTLAAYGLDHAYDRLRATALDRTREGETGSPLALGSPWPLRPWQAALADVLIEPLLLLVGVRALVLVGATFSDAFAAGGGALGALLPWAAALALFLATYVVREARWSADGPVLAALGLPESRGRAAAGTIALALSTLGWGAYIWAMVMLRPFGGSAGFTWAAAGLVTLAGVLSAVRAERGIAALAWLVAATPLAILWAGLAALGALVASAAWLCRACRRLLPGFAWPGWLLARATGLAPEAEAAAQATEADRGARSFFLPPRR